MPTTADLIAALLLGLAGAGHCLGMCGGIAIALRPVAGGSRWLPVSYQFGRVLSYALLGALVGGAAGAVALAQWTIALRFIAGLLLVLMGLSVLNVWQGVAQLERLGGVLWRRIVPLTRPLIPPRNPAQGLALGALWGFMPCGLIYSALGWSAASGAGAAASGLLMLTFGIGTIPAMLATTLASHRAERLLRNRKLKQLIGVMLLAGGIWTLWHTATHADMMLAGPGAHDMHRGHH